MKRRSALLPFRAPLLALVLVWLVLLLGGCASAPLGAPPAPVLRDALFAPPSEPIDAADVFALDAAMRHYLEVEIAGSLRAKGRQRGLVEALYNKQQLKIDYDATMTRNAAQAFDARAGNCLSLVIMTAALAKDIGLGVQYQSIFVDDTWSRSGSLYVASGHVNLTLLPRPTDLRTGPHDTSLSTTIDFLPPEDLRGQRGRTISEATVLAMYMNNRAAEALAQGRLDDAYAWAREAIAQDPRFLSGHNTLGVIYLRHGNRAEAEQVFRSLVAVEPDNTTALSNLAQLLGESGRTAEAEQVARRLAAIQPEPPFMYFNLGMAAMQRGDYRSARDQFTKEVNRAAYYHEFHFWLALAYAGLGDMPHARAHLATAVENSTRRDDRDLYAAKLDRLNLHR
jgi:tetratricopeptide (TPR) repeat protein